jgi:hypothetical protein
MGSIDIKKEIKTATEGLEGRYAVCSQHKLGTRNSKVPSRWDLPFFTYRPQYETDDYYCGCRGWN